MHRFHRRRRVGSGRQVGLARRDLLLGAGVAVVAAASGVIAARRLAAPPDVAGLLWPNPRTVPAMALLDADGQPFDNRRLAGRWSFIFFGYTYCPDVCPATLAQMAQVLRELRAEEGDGDVQVVFVSVDPKRDLGPRLGEYVRYFDAAFIGASAPQARIDDFTRALGVPYILGEPDADGHYLVDHYAAVLLVDPQGRWVGNFGAPHHSGDILARYRQIRDFVDARA